MAGAIEKTIQIPKKNLEINLDALDKIAKHLEISDVFNLRKASKSANKIIIEANPTFTFTALSLKQTIARHKLYKYEHFNKFLDQTFLEENKIYGNIYGSKNQKKIILKLLEKIEECKDILEKQKEFQNLLENYLKGCDFVDLSYRDITDVGPLAACTNLQTLYLFYCTDVDVLELRARLPNLKIIT